jgi:hypothetical protein
MPTFKEPAPGATHVPLKNFNLLLHFNDFIQAGTGDITLSEGGAEQAKVACNAGPNLLELKNSRALIRVVPTASDGLLSSAAQHKVIIPSTCFKNTMGEVMEDPPPEWTFTTVTKGTTYLDYDFQSPRPIDRTSPTDSIHSPLSGTWVESTDNFVLYFTEAVQKGETDVIIRKQSAGANVLWETINVGSAAASKVQFDKTWPGKVTISPR